VAVTQQAVDDVVGLLDLEAIEVNIIRGTNPETPRGTVFGGLVTAQSLAAAQRTIDDDRSVHSLHAYFLRPGQVGVPIVYEVDRIRDGRSFSTRRVVAIQHGEAIFNMAASFHVLEPGFEHARPFPVGTPEPESLPDFAERVAARKTAIPREILDMPRPIDQRNVDIDFDDRHEHAFPPHQRVWIKASGDLGDDPRTHACLLAYASDASVLDTSLLPHRRTFMSPDMMMASIDHAMWFHKAFRMDEWLLYEQDSPVAQGARGLGRGLVYTREGELVASVAQEGLIRKLER